MNKVLWDPQRGDWFCLEEVQVMKGEWKLEGFIRQRCGGQRRKSAQRMSEKQRPGGRKSMVWHDSGSESMDRWSNRRSIVNVWLGSLASSSEKGPLVPSWKTDSFPPLYPRALYTLAKAHSPAQGLGTGC